jgi:hypothetical protein
MPDLDTSSSAAAPSLLKSWLLSGSVGRQASTVIAFICLIGLIGTLRGEELNLDTALAFSGLIVAAIVLDALRALSKRDPVYGFSLGWKIAFAVQATMVTATIGMVVLVLQKSDSVSELWSMLFKAGIGYRWLQDAADRPETLRWSD